MIVCKSQREIETMDRANRLVHRVLARLVEMVEPGLATSRLDREAERICREADAEPAFKGYRGFPASVCVSINDEVVHGIPSPERILAEGDLVSMDFGVLLDGYYGDSAVTVGVGDVGEDGARLMEATRESLELGIRELVPGARLSDYSAAVQTHVEERGFSIVREFVGHGIGTSLHEEPAVPNYGEPGHGPKLREGMVLAVEPMVTAGSWRVVTGDDNWTVTTEDGSLAAHFEYSVAVTQSGPRVLGLDRESGREAGSVAGEAAG